MIPVYQKNQTSMQEGIRPYWKFITKCEIMESDDCALVIAVI